MRSIFWIHSRVQIPRPQPITHLPIRSNRRKHTFLSILKRTLLSVSLYWKGVYGIDFARESTVNQSIWWAGSLERFPIFISAEILWKSGFGRVSSLESRRERIVSHQRTLIWLRCDGSAHWIIEQPQSFHCLRIRFDSLSFPVALSTIDDWVTLEVHYPLWPTLWFIGLLPTITMKPSGIFLCAQHSPGPRRSWASYCVISPRVQHSLNPRRSRGSYWVISPAFNIHWIPDVPEQAVGLSPPRTFTEFWHVFVRSVWWNISKLRLWLRHYRVPPRARF